jgi:hypothetical protein
LQTLEFEGKFIMDQINAGTNNSSDNLTTSIIGGIKRTMAREYEREMAEKLLAGKGFFLELEQLAVVRENLAKVLAMARLVARSAQEEGVNTELIRDVHAAMSLALQELAQIDQMIIENATPECQSADSSAHESSI